MSRTAPAPAPTPASPPELTVATSANSFGMWRARIDFSHTLSESDNRPEFNLNFQWARIRRRARTAILSEIADREQKTGETRSDVETRVRASLRDLQVIEQHVYSDNTWHGVTLGEGDSQ